LPTELVDRSADIPVRSPSLGRVLKSQTERGSVTRSHPASQDAFAINRKRLGVWTWLRLTEPRSDMGNVFWKHAPARIFHRESCAADFQVCCIAGFQTRRRHGFSTPCRFGNRRYSRFGNLRYAGFARDRQSHYEISNGRFTTDCWPAFRWPAPSFSIRIRPLRQTNVCLCGTRF